MDRREHPIVPSQAAADGALDIFVEGCAKDDVRQMLVGLSVLRSATAGRVDAAIARLELRRQLPRGAVAALLAR
jgi:hypothetical protein